MKTKTINIIAGVILIAETILQSIGVLGFPPETQRYIIIGIAPVLFILNGIRIHFSAMNPVVWINIIAFAMYFLGGLADLLDIVTIPEEIKVAILRWSGLAYLILNIVTKSLFKLDYSTIK